MTRSFRSRDLVPAAATVGLALLTAAPAALRAQSGEEVLRTLLERYEERMSGVENYTVVQEAMGFSSTTYFERTDVDGHSVFVPRQTLGSEAAGRAPAGSLGELFRVAERASLEGSEQVDGERCHVVTLSELEGTELFGSGSVGQGDFRPRSATLLVDVDDYLLRRLTVEGTTVVDGSSRDVTFTAHLRDYREVDGVLHPFRTDITVEGMTTGMSEAEREQMRASLEQMRARMEEMPEAQREMMEKMMGGKMEEMEKMIASGAMDVTIRVTEIRVNEGPPEGG